MCKKAIFSLTKLQELANDSSACVIKKTISLTLPLQPLFLNKIKEGLWSSLYAKLKKYDSQLSGIVLGYDKVRVDRSSCRFGRNGNVIFPVQCDAYIFEPYVGCDLKGVVNRISPDHIGCIVHQYFNATIHRPEEESCEEWANRHINFNDVITFRVKDLDFTGSIPYIEGRIDLVNECGPKNKEQDETEVKELEEQALRHLLQSRSQSSKTENNDMTEKARTSVLSSTQLIADLMNGPDFDNVSPIRKAESSRATSPRKKKKEILESPKTLNDTSFGLSMTYSVKSIKKGNSDTKSKITKSPSLSSVKPDVKSSVNSVFIDTKKIKVEKKCAKSKNTVRMANLSVSESEAEKKVIDNYSSSDTEHSRYYDEKSLFSDSSDDDSESASMPQLKNKSNLQKKCEKRESEEILSMSPKNEEITLNTKNKMLTKAVNKNKRRLEKISEKDQKPSDFEKVKMRKVAGSQVKQLDKGIEDSYIKTIEETISAYAARDSHDLVNTAKKKKGLTPRKEPGTVRKKAGVQQLDENISAKYLKSIEETISAFTDRDSPVRDTNIPVKDVNFKFETSSHKIDDSIKNIRSDSRREPISEIGEKTKEESENEESISETSTLMSTKSSTNKKAKKKKRKEKKNKKNDPVEQLRQQLLEKTIKQLQVVSSSPQSKSPTKRKLLSSSDLSKACKESDRVSYIMDKLKEESIKGSIGSPRWLRLTEKLIKMKSREGNPPQKGQTS